MSVHNFVPRGGASRLGVVAAAAAAAATGPHLPVATSSLAFISGREGPVPVQHCSREGRIVFFRADQGPDPGRDYGTGTGSQSHIELRDTGAGLRFRHASRPVQAGAQGLATAVEVQGSVGAVEAQSTATAVEAQGSAAAGSTAASEAKQVPASRPGGLQPGNAQAPAHGHLQLGNGGIFPQPIAEGQAVAMPSWLWRTFIHSLCLSSDAARVLWEHKGEIIFVVGGTATAVSVAAALFPAAVLPILGASAGFLSKAAIALSSVAAAHPIAGEHCYNICFHHASLKFPHLMQ